jgi:hypothetical protein
MRGLPSTLMRVERDAYLDHRLPAWLDLEILGQVRYNATARCVDIHPGAGAVLRRLLLAGVPLVGIPTAPIR